MDACLPTVMGIRIVQIRCKWQHLPPCTNTDHQGIESAKISIHNGVGRARFTESPQTEGNDYSATSSSSSKNSSSSSSSRPAVEAALAVVAVVVYQ